MAPSPPKFLEFIENLLHVPGKSPHVCADRTEPAQAVISAFITSPQPDALYVIVHGEKYSVVSELARVQNDYDALLVLIKQIGPLSDAVPLLGQVQVMNIPRPNIAETGSDADAPSSATTAPEFDSFDQIKNMLAYAIAPYFDYVAQTESSEFATSASYSSTKKKISELAMSLRHLKQRLVVPDLLVSVPTSTRAILDNPEAANDPEILADSAFLNELTKIVNAWIGQIQDVTSITRNPAEESVQNEVQFWSVLESALTSLKEQTSRPQIKRALDILNAARRFQTTLAFQNNLGIAEKLEETKAYNVLLKDLPLSELAFSKDNLSLSALEQTVEAIFSHLKRWKNSSSFPLGRMIELIELLLEEIGHKLAQMLTESELLTSPQSHFEALCEHEVSSLFSTIASNLKFMVNILRELMRKRQDKFMAVRIHMPTLDSLQERVQSLRLLRKNHESLIQGLQNLDDSQTESLSLAYSKHIAPANPFDLSKSATSLWESSQKLYQSTYIKASEKLRFIVNRKFDECASFTDYCSLMMKMRQNASDSSTVTVFLEDKHRLNILDSAYSDISKLLAVSYQTRQQIASKNSFEAPIAILLWEMEIKSKIDFYFSHLGLLLGENWNRYSTGAKIESETEAYLGKVNSAEIIAKWVEFAAEKVKESQNFGQVLLVQDTRLIVNYDEELFLLLKQAETLLGQGFEVPVNVQIRLDRIKVLYPWVQSLIEHLDVFESILGNLGKFQFLLESRVNHIMSQLQNIMAISWSQIISEIDIYESGELQLEVLAEESCLGRVKKLQDDIYKLQVQHNLIQKNHEALYSECFSAIKTCEYTAREVSNLVEKIQGTTFEITRSGFSNVGHFVNTVNEDLSNEISQRCVVELSQISSFLLGDESGRIPTSVHTISMENDVFFIYPPLESSKQKWVAIVDETLGLLSSQRKLFTIDRGEYFTEDCSPGLSNAALSALEAIECQYQKARKYYSQWVFLQELFSKQSTLDSLFEESSDSLPSWLEVVENSLSLRKLFEGRETFHLGSVLQIDFARIQPKVIGRFRSFSKALGQAFSEKVKKVSSDILDELTNALTTLNSSARMEGDSISVLKYVGQIYRLNSKRAEWGLTLRQINVCQSLMYRQNIRKDNDWIYAEQLESKLANAESLIDQRLQAISNNFDTLSLKFEKEWARTRKLCETLQNEWDQKKPLTADLVPETALKVLARFKSQSNDLKGQAEILLQIASALEIAFENDIAISSIQIDIDEMRQVWSALQTLWDSLEIVKRQKWSDVHIRTLRSQLEKVNADARSCSHSIRQYSAFEALQNDIKGYIFKINNLSELKSDAIKDRHWEQIFSLVGLDQKSKSSVLVRDVMNIDFDVYSSVLSNIIAQANAEQLVQDSLDSIRSEWETIVFETFDYGKCRLVKNWNQLFEQCTTNLSTLESVKNANFSSQYERDRDELESKINEIEELLNVWVKVQRQWVYLDGIFGASNEIKSSLPLEASRFNNISFDFMNLLKKSGSVVLVWDVLSIKGIFKAMQKISDSLDKTVKSLSHYLDTQRENFPRFFFVGNEDLLELLGSGTNVNQINKHAKQMFAGVASLDFDKNSSSIVSIVSSQGEIVRLEKPVSLIQHQELGQWLTVLESEIKVTLSNRICEAVAELQSNFAVPVLKTLVEKYPCQALTVAFQVFFTSKLTNLSDGVERNLALYKEILTNLSILAASETGLANLKIRSLVVELIHHRDVLLELQNSEQRLVLQTQQLYYCNSNAEPMERILVKQGSLEFHYGFEYQGVSERLAVTPLVNKCFLAMSQSIAQKLGGSPFGPAGTGKTECVKALGLNLGRTVLTFCCDETFDSQAMARILLGVSKVGCWVCFDEFNRLDPKILSALSSEIEHIQRGLRESKQVEVFGKPISIHIDTGIFVTMNPGYVGRNELPDNLKKLFRAFSMEKPDSEKITEVLLTSHGFADSANLSASLVPFFTKIEQKLSKQPHYDFGLRALKSILNSAGAIKKEEDSPDSEIISRALSETIRPKLVKEDEWKFERLFAEHYAHGQSARNDARFIEAIDDYAETHGLEVSPEILKKATQLAQIQAAHHGIMLVGESGCGKSTVLDLTLHAMEAAKSAKYEKVVIDSKVIPKNVLYGSLDPLTREWTDGLLTQILRAKRANLKGEAQTITWVVFDGDIDPEWAENLNSLLDDNRLLTLPNGERLELPDNMRIVFEVDSLKATTPATVSRCGMVWFDAALVSYGSLWRKGLFDIKSGDILPKSGDFIQREHAKTLLHEVIDTTLALVDEGVLGQIIDFASSLPHIMPFNRERLMAAFFSHFKISVAQLLEHQIEEASTGEFRSFVQKALLLSFIWAVSGDSELHQREKTREFLSQLSLFSSLDVPENIYQCKISLSDFEWSSWQDLVEHVDLEPHQVLAAGSIVPTVDTVIHESLIHGIVNKHSPLILCGPPGSGKTMTLLKALRSSPNLDLITLNFSKDTGPETLLRSIEQHCEYRKTTQGTVLAPKVSGKWVVVFCDEINLPAADKYGTQRVIAFMRQLVEHGGFWKPSELTWVSLHNVQFVGACNDPNDPGRNQLPDRFMRHVTLVMVGYPSSQSMHVIYETFNSAALKCVPNLRSFSHAVTKAMLHVYEETRAELNAKRSHYIYSPREISRWCKGVLETLLSFSCTELGSLVRLWYHEGLRLFYDRLVSEDEKSWCKNLFKKVAEQHFPNTDLETAMQWPVLYSTWITGQYESVSESQLVPFVKERLRVFSEEELEIDLVLFEDMLDHALRIDRVLRQHQGHMILVGPSTIGKSTLTKFVAWINGMKLVELSVHSKFTISEFEESLRELLIGCARGEEVCYLIDESSILETAFIERMNSLLANSEIPGLFEGEDLETLKKTCHSEASSQGVILDSEDELFEWFSRAISANLHVVFTMNGLENQNSPQINSSPALFNRCVLSWMGEWSDQSLRKVADNMVSKLPLDQSDYTVSSETPVLFRDAVIDVLISLHRSVKNTFVAPKQFVNLVELFGEIYTRCQTELEENQRHTNIGLDKLRETVLEVTEMKKLLSEKKEVLTRKDAEARTMLNKMIVEQNEAERKQEFSVAAKSELEKQEAEINKRRHAVMQDLELAEPAVLEAQQGVQNIKKQHLTEMRSMANPPAAVKMAMESVCVLLGYDAGTWRDVQLIVRKDDFITSIVSFDNETQLTPDLRQYMESVYLSRDDFNYETINRASKACGPLLQWVIAQLRFSSILEKVGPLRNEVAALEKSAVKSRAQLMAIAQMIEELELSIEDYKLKYSEVIRDAERIKTEMAQIEHKVQRSLRLIDNLTKERHRWQLGVKTFEQGRARLVGNAILVSALATYAGEQPQFERQSLVADWKAKLNDCKIAFEDSLSLSSLLTTASELAAWKNGGLPDDHIFVDNFAIRSVCDFPFIVDPTGIMPSVLKSAYPKLILTSFLHENFTNVMEDALRFGGVVLIQNAEYYNPILDRVIRKEVSHLGGRKSLKFGTKVLRISDDLTILLYTKDSSFRLPPFLKARTTVLNFSVTKGNLENQVLNISLERSKPELYTKRSELIALQSEYNVRQLDLRKKLLSTLNEVKGTILESDDIIISLEHLEKESSEIDMKMAESDEVMNTVNDVRAFFTVLANHSIKIFAILEAFTERSRFYNFSLDGFITIFRKVLVTSDVGDTAKMAKELYKQICSELSCTFQDVDRTAFFLALASAYQSIEVGEHVETGLCKILDSPQVDEKSLHDVFGFCVDSSADVGKWSDVKELHKDNQAFSILTTVFDEISAKGLSDALYSYYSKVLGFSEQEFNFSNLEVIDKRPVLLCLSEGYDVTTRVQKLANSANIQLLNVSLGTNEGSSFAHSALEDAKKHGKWVLIQNLHMAISWLTHLETAISGGPFHENFHVFMTCALDSADIPSGLIGISRVVTIQSQPKWKKILLETFTAIADVGDSVKLHVLFLVSWYHSTIMERLKYVPVSFKSKHDITDVDAAAAAFAVTKILEEVGRVNEQNVPWSEIAFRLGEIIYGGKIAHAEDSRFCAEFAKELFCARSFTPDFNLIESPAAKKAEMSLSPPQATTFAKYVEWIDELPENAPLEWIGLSGSVRHEMKEEIAKTVAKRAVQVIAK